MDRGRRDIRDWIVALTLLAGLAACQSDGQTHAPSEIDIAALNWIGTDVDPVVHLSQEPTTCLAHGDMPRVLRGELLFNSPLLLGGQAAKAELSCAACHRNGRGNPDFVLPGLSDVPGTADVSNGFFSKLRADRVFNPVRIPDLARAEGRTRVDRQTEGVLETFLHAQIVEEFAGSAPERETVLDLAAYIRALDDRACDTDEVRQPSWRDEMKRLRTGADHINKTQTAVSIDYINAMRAALGRLHARYQGPQLAAVRDQMVKISRDLAAD
ncbi:MAG: hypothetical protein AAF582_12910, partial [Pseudomonadota bacterium]